MKIVWSPVSIKRIEEIVDHISEDSRSAAKKVATQLFHSIERLKKFPKSGRVALELKRKDIREIIKSGYRIVYRLEDQRIVILTVRHSRQQKLIGKIAHAKDYFINDDPIRGSIM